MSWTLPPRGDLLRCGLHRLLVKLVVFAGCLGLSGLAPVLGQEIKTSQQPAKKPAVAIARPGKTAYPRISLAAGYDVDSTWPHAAHEETAWGAMAGVAVDPEGKIWTFNRGPKPVQVFSVEGKPLFTWEPTTADGRGQEPVEFREPHQVRFDREGNLWLVDSGLHVVRQFTRDGKLLRTLGTPGEAGDDSSHFNKPTDIAISRDGELYISDGYGNNRIVHFDAKGSYLDSWGSLGSEPGEFSLPHAIAIDSHERLYVADRNNARIQVFDRSGKFLAQWRNLMVPWHIVINERDEIYVCGSSPMRWPRGSLGTFKIPGLVLGVPPKDQLVMVFSPEGHVRRLWTFPMGKKAGELDWVHGMAVDPQGNLYLGDILGRRAQRFVHVPADPAEGAGGFFNNLAKKKPKQDTPVQRTGGEAVDRKK